MDEYKHVIQNNQEYVLVPVKEFHGLKKALNIIHERAVTQIDKGTADEYGYQFLRAQRRNFNGSKEKYWHVTQRTPYSLEIEPSVALQVIESDLKIHYNYTEDEKTYMYVYKQMQSDRKVTFQDKKHFMIQGILEETKNFSFGLDALNYNFAQGVYEIQYYMQEIEGLRRNVCPLEREIKTAI